MKLQTKFAGYYFFSVLITFLFITPQLIFGQTEECGMTEIPPEEYNKIIDIYNSRDSKLEGNGRNMVIDIPVYFSVFRRDDGTANANITQSHVNTIITNLNTYFSGTGFNFIQVGSISYIDNTFLYGQDDAFGGQGGNYPIFSYQTAALNFIIRKSSGLGYAWFPWFSTFNKRIVVSDNAISSNDYPHYTHEAGHSFGLLHTHNGIPGTTPNFLAGNTDPTIVNRAEELVIRQFTSGKTWPNPNWSHAGDLLEDTPADCNRTQDANCTYNSTTCILTGTIYQDENGDQIMPLMNNFMSYWRGCRTQFTTDQINKMVDMYNLYRGDLDPNQTFDHLDDIEFEGSNNKVESVFTNLEFPNMFGYQSNFTSNSAGSFQGMLYDNNVKIKAIKLPAKNVFFFLDDYSHAEWVDGVSSFDAFLIAKHINGIQSLNGYRQIAADVNNSETITSTDQDEIIDLVLTNISKFSGWNRPLEFIPEFIPQNHSTNFNNNPFGTITSGVNYPAYINDGFTYTISNGTGGIAGFDAIKFGDMNASTSHASLVGGEIAVSRNPKVTLEVSEDFIPEETIFELEITAKGFENIVAYQMGWFFDNENLELLEISKGDVKDFSVDNFSTTYLAKNEFRTAWVSKSAKPYTPRKSTIFKLKVQSKNTLASLKKTIRLDDDILKSVFYNEEGQPVKVDLKLKLKVLKSNSVNTEVDNKKIIPNSVKAFPNPVSNKLELAFELPYANKGLINIFDKTGRKVYTSSNEFTKGYNRILINNISDLPVGLLVLEIQAGDKILTGKVFKVK